MMTDDDYQTWVVWHTYDMTKPLDQRFINTVQVPIKNPVTGKVTMYLMKKEDAMTQDSTEPNLKANTPRNLTLRAWAWIKSHPEHAIRGSIFIAGLVLGAVLF